MSIKYPKLLPRLALCAAALALFSQPASASFQYRVSAVGTRAPAPLPVQGWSVAGTPTTTFAAATVGQFAIPDLTVQLTNTGAATDSFTVPAFTGANTSDFSASSNCANVLANAICTVTVRFKPTVAGTRTASLVLGATSPLVFTGTGAAPVDPYFSNVSLLLHMDGANGSTNFTDARGHAVSRIGAITLSTDQHAFGTSALAAVASGAYLSVPSNTETAFGNKDFTVEAWVYFNAITISSYRPIYTNYSSWGAGGLYLGGHASYNGNMSFMSNGVFNIHETAAVPLNQWVHYAFVRKGTSVAIYRDGVQTASSTISAGAVLTPASNPNYIAGTPDAGSLSTQGYIDELRVTTGVARYTGSFTPPSAAFADQ